MFRAAFGEGSDRVSPQPAPLSACGERPFPGSAGVSPASRKERAGETPALPGGEGEEALTKTAPRRAASNPALKPRRLASEDFPARIAPSNASTGIGSRPDA